VELNVPLGDRRLALVSRALSHKLRLRILEYLAGRESTVKEVYESLGDIKYRDTVFRHLETLKEAGLVIKFYDDETKALKYKIAVRTVRIGLTK
jgi:DNA-binding transcriptional ArsR family regulator